MMFDDSPTPPPGVIMLRTDVAQAGVDTSVDETVQSTRLAELERQIEEGVAAFIAVGTSLRLIRDERLWAPRYDRFEDYLRARWGHTTRRADQVIRAAWVGKKFLDAGLQLGGVPMTETHVRELDDLEPGEAVRVYQAAIQQFGRAVTAKKLRSMRSEMLPHRQRPSRAKRGARVTSARLKEMAAEVRAIQAREAHPQNADISSEHKPLYDALQTASESLSGLWPDDSVPFDPDDARLLLAAAGSFQSALARLISQLDADRATVP